MVQLHARFCWDWSLWGSNPSPYLSFVASSKDLAYIQNTYLTTYLVPNLPTYLPTYLTYLPNLPNLPNLPTYLPAPEIKRKHSF